MCALLVASGLVVAVSCGSDDGSKGVPGASAGESGAPDGTAGMGAGAGLSHGGNGASAGVGATTPGAGGAGAPSAGAGLGGEPSVPPGGAGGDAYAGEGGAGGDAGAGGASAEPPLFADDFDAEALQSGGVYSTNYVEFAAWDVTSGSVDVTVLPNGFIDSPGGYGAGQPASGVVVDLNGSTLQNGVLETKAAITFQPAVEYTLRYALGNAKNQTNSVSVTIPGLVSETRTQMGATAFTVYESKFTPPAAITAKLTFTSSGGGDDDGLLLDSVSISP